MVKRDANNNTEEVTCHDFPSGGINTVVCSKQNSGQDHDREDAERNRQRTEEGASWIQAGERIEVSTPARCIRPFQPPGQCKSGNWFLRVYV